LMDVLSVLDLRILITPLVYSISSSFTKII
jgi:hypothetical protein